MSSKTRMGPRQPERLFGSALVVSLLLLLVPAAATGTAPAVAGINIVDVWTNDDGHVNGPDVGDDGGPITSFDAWGPLSSADPHGPGIATVRLDKDVARCTGTIGEASGVLHVDAAYPGYVCTAAFRVRNETAVPADLSPPTIAYDEGLTVGQLIGLPSVLGPGEEATAAFWVEVEQWAPLNGALRFTITIGASGRTCAHLSDDDIPTRAILINASGQCTYFFDAKPGPCGPGWTAEEPYAWHFVVNKTGGETSGETTALFASTGWLVTDSPTAIHRNNLHFYLYTQTPDTLVGAYLEGISGAKLVLSHTCNDPVRGGHER